MTERRYGGEVEPVEILDRRAGVRCECKCRLVDSSGSLPVSHLSASLHLIGLISDTHGLIRPEALDALRDSELIVHCGDIGGPAVLEALGTLAPVRAVRGNNDKGAWASRLPTYDVLEVGIHAFYVLHNSRNSSSIRMPLASRPSCPVTLTSL